MTVAITVEDEAWRAVAGLEEIARAAVTASLDTMNAGEGEVALLFTDDAEMARLNACWRGQAKPTNVLSFPAPAAMSTPPGTPRPLGDIVLSSGVVASEAAQQGKTLERHMTHLIVHGVLHLLGHDHAEEAQGQAMERAEAQILSRLGHPDPYADEPP